MHLLPVRLLSARLRIVALLLIGLASIPPLSAHSATPPSQQPPDQTPTIQITSRLVYLDVTVLDKKNHPVTSGLTQDDFTITEEKKPQRIFSFQPPDAHGSADSPSGQPPITIFVLDQLNSSFEQMGYIRYQVHQYLATQPDLLPAPAEVLIVGNRSLELLQAYTRNKSELLYAVDHLPSALPYKFMNGAFWAERFEQSVDALQEIALQNSGIPGRKNIIWVGHGGPSIYTTALVGGVVDQLNQFVHQTTNMLVDARMSLFVIYPWLSVRNPTITYSEQSAEVDPGDTDPFAGDINFGVFVNATGGKLFFNRNDIDTEIKTSIALGSNYYTLTYQPPMDNPSNKHDFDGHFKRIRVNLRNPGLHAVTKVGYFAPDKNAVISPQQQALFSLMRTTSSTIAFDALDLTARVTSRHPDANTGTFKLNLSSKNLSWNPTDQGKSITSILVQASSLSSRRETLSSKTEALTLTAPTQNPADLARTANIFSITLRVPRKAKSVRFAVSDPASNRIGTAEIDRTLVDQAPPTPTPIPPTDPQPLKQGQSSTHPR